MANNYLMKFKGRFRILPELDKETNDFPRNPKGEIDESYDDIYISCQYGNKITTYGHMPDNQRTMWLTAYIPSLGRGRNIKKAMDAKGVPYIHYHETDEEVEFRFKAKDIDEVATLLKAKTSGANISPFSSKNLPKADVKIPTEEIERYKTVIADVQQGDLLLIHRLTDAFLSTILTRKYKKIVGRSFNYQTDIKKMKMARMTKEYIFVKNMWEEYLVYLKKEIAKFYNK